MNDPSNSESARLRSQDTQQVDLSKAADPDSDGFDVEDSYGRYRVVRTLGRGGFGRVFLGHDPVLDRSVAIKVPKQFRRLRPDTRARFIEEGRSLAKLAHPAIVAVFDVGVSKQGQPFVVMEFVSGQSLAQWLKSRRLALDDSLDLLLQVASGLNAMHQTQVVHRDLKPGNVVIDVSNRARIIDFGLALNDGIPLRKSGRHPEGTPAYMAPEQVRGLNHLLDGRTDIWSFGVMMYQMLSGRLPFGGRKTADLGYRICAVDPQPLRQLNSAISPELERICLRCLGKAMSARYPTVSDLIKDLTEARRLAGPSQVSGNAALTPPLDRGSDSLHPIEQHTPLTPMHASTVTNVMTHGLRAFTQHDADFYFELLPGQRDAHGVPETILFWKDRLDPQAPPAHMAVGLIYGPSGCGKTSFVRAGLLPRLSHDCEALYVECDVRQTEDRLGRLLRQKFPALDPADSLDDQLRRLRLDEAILGSKRVLLILDQFEQWLRPPRQLQREPLVEALRQLDGDKLRCLILVRDDFWMGITQLMRTIDQRIQEGVNAMAYPLFDRGHAEKVLTAFGQALNCLPHEPVPLTKSQREFVVNAVKSFARNGKVICVHLALFAQMMRDRRWEVAELRRVGGWKGVGVRYLEETFSDPNSPRMFRRFLPEISAILERLLPAGKRDVKGGMVSEVELRRHTNLHDRGDDFEHILEILLNSARLITQVDGGTEAESTSERYYQLSHDFLVAPIHDWLEKQRLGTWRGRAHLRLAELANQWMLNDDSRFLPGWGDWLRMRLGVPGHVREPYAKFLGTAGRRLLGQAAIATAILLIAAIVGLGLNANGRRRTAAARVEALFAVGPAKLEAALNSLRSSYRWARQPLDEAMHDEKRPAIWRGHMARIQCDDRVSESRIGMVDSLDRIPTEEVPMVIEVLRQSGPNAVDLLARKFAEASEPQVRARLATILLFLGQAGPARESLAVRLHPAERTRFIRDFAACAPEIGSLTALVRGVDDRDFESGICLAVGRIPAPQLAADVRSAWVDWLRQVFAISPGGGSHSAAQWALRQWNEPVPPLQPQDDPPTDRDWWVMEPVPGYRLTLVRIPAGSFLSGASVPDRLFELVSETRPVAPANVENFWVCTVEVEQGLFSIYRNSLPPERRAAERLDRFIPTDAAESAHLPVAGVNWEVAVDFCNWLSRQTGRAECYGAAAAFPLDLNASGWRLPLRLEWEYACLARATTLFPFGNLEQIDSLADYSWHLSPQIGFDTPVQEVGSKMPNPWGLFDMLGNANEWCSDGKLGIAESRFAVGGHNTSSIDALYAGFPGYNHFKIDRDFQGIRLCLPDRPPAGRDDPDQ